MRGANRTGRPFTGDYAGDLLYPMLAKHGFTDGDYRAAPNDGLVLNGCQITNAVRCVPPENKPVGAEIAACRRFLQAEIASLTELQVILALGTVAHNAILTTLDVKRADFTFSHGAVHDLGPLPTLVDSYHCSRYNVNTRRLTPEMFDEVVGQVRNLLSHLVRPRPLMIRALSRCQSRCFSLARLSYAFLPRARPSSTLATPRSLK